MASETKKSVEPLKKSIPKPPSTVSICAKQNFTTREGFWEKMKPKKVLIKRADELRRLYPNIF